MDFDYSPKVQELRSRVDGFMQEFIFPQEHRFHQEVEENTRNGRRWTPTRVVEELKAKARAAGLWNLFLPESKRGAGLTNLEYAPLAELMGGVTWASEVFNCSAPDTGNMELLQLYGTDEQKSRWLLPLLNGEIRSGFMMTEPEVASSDATNIRTEIRRDGDDYVINGRKWWITNAGDPRCRLFIVMGLTDPDAERVLSTKGPTATLRLSEGCSHPCSFCVIPKLRGGLQSRQPIRFQQCPQAHVCGSPRLHPPKTLYRSSSCLGARCAECRWWRQRDVPQSEGHPQTRGTKP